MACFWLISAPAVYYTTSNLSIVSFFPKISGFLLILLPSICDMSSGLFLLFKLAYENLNYDLVTMLQILTASTALVWLRALNLTIREIWKLPRSPAQIRTFLLMPYFRADLNCSLFEQSFIGRCFFKKEKQSDNLTESDNVGMKDLLPILKEFNIYQFTAFYTILCFRIKSIQGKNNTSKSKNWIIKDGFILGWIGLTQMLKVVMKLFQNNWTSTVILVSLHR